MTSKFTELAIDCADPNGLARFWCSVLDYEGKTKTTELSQLAPLWCLKARTTLAHIATVIVVQDSGRFYPEAIIFTTTAP